MEVIKIKNILTAIGDPFLNKKLKEINTLNIVNNDIQYQDGVLEFLELNKNIDFLIIDQLLPGELQFDELIENIQDNNPKIKIIIILKKYNDQIEKIFIKKGVYRIIYNNLKLENLIKIINENDKMEQYNQEIQKEIDDLKKYIDNKNNIKKNNKSKNNIEKIEQKYEIKNKIKNHSKKEKIEQKNIMKNNNSKKEKINQKNIMKNDEKNNKINNKINKVINKIKNIKKMYKNLLNKNNKFKINNNKIVISVLGNNGAGKSIFSVLLSKELEKYFNKILILDFDILNNSIHTILGVKKYVSKLDIKNNNFNIFDAIVKINKKIDLLSDINLIFNNEYKLNYQNLKDFINLLLKKYDAIIIDTTSEIFFEKNKEIINNSNKCIFLTENNLLEISKSKRILKKYFFEWNIEKEKIKIIFNKCNKIKINYDVLKNIYFEYEILGFLKYCIYINYFINKNFNCNFIIEKNIKKITKKIIL